MDSLTLFFNLPHRWDEKKQNKMEQSPIIRSILTVKYTKHLSPNYIRVTLTGDDVPKYAGITIGKNNKIFLPAQGDTEIHFDPQLSIRRTYTHRGIDVDKKEMIIDFVVHGDQGPASNFAIGAKAGDKIGVAMKKSSEPLCPAVDWYLLVADASGIPVIASILESLPATASGKVFLEVLNKEEEIPLHSPADIEINWIHHNNPGVNSPLSTLVKAATVPADGQSSTFGYIAAEFTTVKDIRSYLRKDLGWGKDDFYAYSYWKYGNSEERSEPERRAEKQAIDLAG